MRIAREEFARLLSGVWLRDGEAVRLCATQIAANNHKDPQIQKIVDDTLGKARPFLLKLPEKLIGIVREEAAFASFADLVLTAEIEQAMVTVMREHALADRLVARGLLPTTRLLFHGPSGTGKTACAAALAHAIGLPFFVIPMDAIVSQYMGETSERLRKAIEYVGAESSVVLLDEIDAIGLERGQNDVGEQGRIVTTLLVLLDELRRRRSRTLLIAATNRRDHIDSALARRFDHAIQFSLVESRDQQRIADAVFRRAGLDPKPIPDRWPLLHAPAHVEAWALAHARQAVLAEFDRSDELDHAFHKFRRRG